MKQFAFMIIVLLSISINALSQDKYHITVAQDGSGDYTSIQSAIDACKAFPDQRVVIYIKRGTYHEKVKIPSCNTRLSLVGEDKEHTIISFDDFFDKINRGRNSTFYTSTLLVEADDCSLSNLTVENNAGPVGQAVALHIEGNRCVIRNCNILGNQDTLYASGENSCQYYSRCLIEGTTDFIFGSATALFDSCTLHSKADSYITAASTTYGKEFGFVFIGCRLTASQGTTRVYLGRPWRDFAKVVFIHCELGDHILPAGWSNWDNTSRDQTAFFAEFENRGPGSSTAGRVAWSRQLTSSEINKYTRTKILSPVCNVLPPLDSWIKY